MPYRSPPAALFVLPLHLSDGLVLSGVELDCRGCGVPYRLTSGAGRAGLQGAKVALAASGDCPRCGTRARFLVLVDAVQRKARVQRVSRLGLWFAQAMIRLGAEVQAAPAPEAAPVPVTPPPPAPEVRRAGESLGLYQGVPIPAWISVDGRKMVYAGILSLDKNGLPRIGRREFAIEPGLVYRQPLEETV